MKTTIKSETFYTQVIMFRDNKYSFLNEQSLACEILEEVGVSSNIEDCDVWFDIVLDKEENKYYAVYGAGSAWSDECIYVEIEY